MSAMTPAENVRVCILQRDDLWREVLTRALDKSGFEVTQTYSDLITFCSEPPSESTQVAVLNLLSPLQELALLAEVSQFRPSLRLLVITPEADQTVSEACSSAGVAGVLSASREGFATLVHSIEALARGERAYTSEMFEALLRPGRVREPPPVLRSLSDRERQVLSYLSGGADNLKIATLLQISERTVKAHVSNLYRKLGQENRTQLALLARQNGVRPPAEL
jgi:DNA-binding NarL/FixJ family response regulator